MTVVFAYADRNYAFVAGDTCRTYGGNIQPAACKLHRWSEHVLLAQSGEAHSLTDLIHTLLARVAPFAPTHDGFIQNFTSLHQSFWTAARKHHKGNTPAGTVLVASAAHNGQPARIAELDFETAIHRIIGATFHAHGSDAARFQLLAGPQLTTCTTLHGIELDRWGALCISDAIAMVPSIIKWPADLLITRPTRADSFTLKRRVSSATFAPHPMFLV